MLTKYQMKKNRTFRTFRRNWRLIPLISTTYPTFMSWSGKVEIKISKWRVRRGNRINKKTFSSTKTSRRAWPTSRHQSGSYPPSARLLLSALRTSFATAYSASTYAMAWLFVLTRTPPRSSMALLTREQCNCRLRGKERRCCQRFSSNSKFSRLGSIRPSGCTILRNSYQLLIKYSRT